MKRRVLDGIIGYVTLTVLGVVATHSYHVFSPRDWWFTYHEYVIADVQTAGNAISVDSYATIRRPVNIRYVDILRCDLDDGRGMRNYSSQPFNIDNHFPSTAGDAQAPEYGPEAHLSPWKYASAVPDSNAVCEIRGVQTIVFPYGVEKSMELTSNTFAFVEPYRRRSY